MDYESNIFSPDDMEKIKQKYADKKKEKLTDDPDSPYDGHIVFEDDLEKMRNKADPNEATNTNSLEEPPVENTNEITTTNPEDQKMEMCDNHCSATSDDTQEVKKEVVENKEPETNSAEESPEELAKDNVGPNKSIQLTNVIIVPDNCPRGQVMDANGICRDVF